MHEVVNQVVAGFFQMLFSACQVPDFGPEMLPFPAHKVGLVIAILRDGITPKICWVLAIHGERVLFYLGHIGLGHIGFPLPSDMSFTQRLIPSTDSGQHGSGHAGGIRVALAAGSCFIGFFFGVSQSWQR